MKKTAFITCFILVVLVLTYVPSCAVTAEHRAFWIDGWHTGMWTQAEIDTMIDQAYNHGHYNVIVPQVRKKSDSLYNSNYGGPSGTGEPKPSQVSPSSFDPLQYMIEQAHARGMEVHPWLCTHRVATQSYDWFVTSHANWLTLNSAGAYPDPAGYEGYYLDPGVPDGEEYTVNLIMDLVKDYDIDGIQWDRIRLPVQDSGYNAISIQRFKAEPGWNYTPAPNDSNFTTWRQQQFNQFVARTYAQIMEVKPQVKVGANTFASYSDASTNRLQDWNAWMFYKWLDINEPMNYTSTRSTFDTRLQDALSRAYGRYVYCGLSIGIAGSATGVTEISDCRSYNAGYLVPWGSQTYSYYYSYTGTTAGWCDYVSAAGRPFQYAAPLPAPMPWKNSPTKGIILGRVTDAAHPNTDPIYHDWIYKATVRLQGPGVDVSTTTDGTGYYVFTEVAPKLAGAAYTITCSKSGFYTQTYSDQAITAGQVLRNDFELSKVSSTKTVTSPAGTIRQGWSWFSLPLSPANPAPDSVLPGLPIDGNLFRWDSPTLSQVMYDVWAPDIFGPMTPGDGYLYRTEDPAPYAISYTGYRGTPARNKSLPYAGWALIGCPFEKEVNWADVMVTRGTSMVPLRTASQYGNNWMSSIGFWWNNVEQSQYDIGLPEDWPSGGTTLVPWHGYWISTFQDGLTLQFRQSAP